MRSYLLWRRFICSIVLVMWAGTCLAQLSAEKTADQGLVWMTDRQAGNCVACHTLGHALSGASNFGPSLERIGSRYSPQELSQWITDARLLKPDTLMPPFGSTQGTSQANRAAPMLNPEQIAAIVATLSSWR